MAAGRRRREKGPAPIRASCRSTELTRKRSRRGHRKVTLIPGPSPGGEARVRIAVPLSGEIWEHTQRWRESARRSNKRLERKLRERPKVSPLLRESGRGLPFLCRD